MSIWKNLDDAYDWIQVGTVAFMAGVTFGMAFGWFIGACVTFGFLTVCVLVARGMKSVTRKSRQTSVPQRSFPKKMGS